MRFQTKAASTTIVLWVAVPPGAPSTGGRPSLDPEYNSNLVAWTSSVRRKSNLTKCLARALCKEEFVRWLSVPTRCKLQRLQGLRPSHLDFRMRQLSHAPDTLFLYSFDFLLCSLSGLAEGVAGLPGTIRGVIIFKLYLPITPRERQSERGMEAAINSCQKCHVDSARKACSCSME